MSIEFLLPSFKDSLCTHITICCDTNSVDVPDGLNEEEYVARYRIPGSYAFFRLAPFKGSNGHIHIDCASYSHFSRAKPKANSRKEKIFNTLSKVDGVKLSASISSNFRVPFNEVSDISIIAGLSKTQKSKDVSLKMVGSKFHIQGSSLHSIEWNLYNNYSMVHAVLRTRMQLIVSDSFISDAYFKMDDLFSQFIIGGHSANKDSE